MEQLKQKLITIFSSVFCLYMKTHMHHFNVMGKNFPQLHKMFDDQYKDLWESVDTTGEIIRTLDTFVPLAPDELKQYSKVQISTAIRDENEMLNDLITGHQIVIELLNDAFPYAEQANKQDIANHFAERLEKHNKFLWMLKATVSTSQPETMDSEIQAVLKNAGLINNNMFY